MGRSVGGLMIGFPVVYFLTWLSMLIAGNSKNWNVRAEHGARGHTEVAARLTNLGQHLHRYAEQCAELFTPTQSVDVVQHRARRVGVVGDVDGAGGFILPTGQSGNPRSPHYRDQTGRWLRGELWIVPVDVGRVRATDTLRLVP